MWYACPQNMATGVRFTPSHYTAQPNLSDMDRSPLELLPYDILNRMVFLLSTRECCSLASVCKTFTYIVDCQIPERAKQLRLNTEGATIDVMIRLIQAAVGKLENFNTLPKEKLPEIVQWVFQEKHLELFRWVILPTAETLESLDLPAPLQNRASEIVVNSEMFNDVVVSCMHVYTKLIIGSPNFAQIKQHDRQKAMIRFARTGNAECLEQLIIVSPGTAEGLSIYGALVAATHSGHCECMKILLKPFCFKDIDQPLIKAFLGQVFGQFAEAYCVEGVKLMMESSYAGEISKYFFARVLVQFAKGGCIEGAKLIIESPYADKIDAVYFGIAVKAFAEADCVEGVKLIIQHPLYDIGFIFQSIVFLTEALEKRRFRFAWFLIVNFPQVLITLPVVILALVGSVIVNLVIYLFSKQDKPPR